MSASRSGGRGCGEGGAHERVSTGRGARTEAAGGSGRRSACDRLPCFAMPLVEGTGMSTHGQLPSGAGEAAIGPRSGASGAHSPQSAGAVFASSAAVPSGSTQTTRPRTGDTSIRRTAAMPSQAAERRRERRCTADMLGPAPRARAPESAEQDRVRSLRLRHRRLGSSEPAEANAVQASRGGSVGEHALHARTSLLRQLQPAAPRRRGQSASGAEPARGA
jgi:hypothetical protein